MNSCWFGSARQETNSIEGLHFVWRSQGTPEETPQGSRVDYERLRSKGSETRNIYMLYIIHKKILVSKDITYAELPSVGQQFYLLGDFSNIAHWYMPLKVS